VSTGGLPQVLVKRVELIKEDLDVYVVEYNNYSNDFVIQKNRLKKLLNPDHYFTLGDNKEEILDIIKKVNPDYIHMEEIPELFNISFEIAQQIYRQDRTYKIFETTHSSDYNVDDKIFFPDKFLFVSQYNCFKFNKFGIPTEVIEYPVEKNKPSKEKKADAMKKLGLDPNYKHVINVGLFTPRKNQAYAFEIARKLSTEKIQFHFIGNQAENFQDYWRPLMKIKPKNCKIWGEKDNVDDFLDAGDLFLFTSRGFRWNKELNPLVIKEALEHEIPQFLFPLDVYNRKYDTENTINYLNGDVNIDADYIKNFLFKPTVNWSESKKYKIRAVQIFQEGDKNEDGIKQFEKLKDFGIDYITMVSPKHYGNIPKEFCARPNDVGRLGAFGLKENHYNDYLGFKRAVLSNLTEDIDFLIILESTCKLNVSIEEFANKIFSTCEPMILKGAFYASFGDDRNLRTGEMVSQNLGQIYDWLHSTDKIIGAQSIMFPSFAFPFIKRAFDTTLWDTPDLMFNDMFKYKGKLIAPRLTTKTISEFGVDNFIVKNVFNLINQKTPEDVIVEYNKEDQKFYFCLSDSYQEDISNFTLKVGADDKKDIYTAREITLSSTSPIWIQIYGHQKYSEFNFEIYHNKQYLYTKNLKIGNINKLEKNIEISSVVNLKIEETPGEIKKIKIEDLIKPEDFNLDYHIDENRIYLPYVGNNKDTSLDIVLKDISTGGIIFEAEDLMFNNGSYCNWIGPAKNSYRDDPNFIGYSIDYVKNDKILFTKELRFKTREVEKQQIDIIANEIKSSEDIIKNNKIVYVITTYPDTKIKEEVTLKCIEAIKSSGNDIILTSHYPISKVIQEKVDYYIYDAYNPLIHHSLYNFYWSDIDKGKVELRLDKLKNRNNLNQSLTVLNNLDNAIKLANKIGYEKVISVNYDFIFKKEEISRIDVICKRIDYENKKGYFLNYSEGDRKLYKSVFFIINPTFYSKVFNDIIRTPETYNEDCRKLGCDNFLEHYFYSKLSSFKDELVIDNMTEDMLFYNGEINIFSGVEYLSILPVKEQPYSFIVWFNSSNMKDNRRIEFVIENNGVVEHLTHFIKERSYFMKKINMNGKDDYHIVANFIDSDTNKIIESYKYNVSMENYSSILENGLFTERKLH